MSNVNDKNKFLISQAVHQAQLNTLKSLPAEVGKKILANANCHFFLKTHPPIQAPTKPRTE